MLGDGCRPFIFFPPAPLTLGFGAFPVPVVGRRRHGGVCVGCCRRGGLVNGGPWGFGFASCNRAGALSGSCGEVGDGRAGAERGLRGGRAADMTAPPEGGREGASSWDWEASARWVEGTLGSGSVRGAPSSSSVVDRVSSSSPWIQIGSFPPAVD